MPRHSIVRNILGSVLTLGCLNVTSEQYPTFRTQSEAVRVEVLVTENGQPVTGLKPSDFELLDNGVRQDVELIGVSQLPVNLILTLDVSESVVGERLTRLEEACAAAVADLRSNDRASLLTFNHRLALRVLPTTDLPRVLEALSRLRAEGATSLRDAAFASLQLAGGIGDGRSLVVIFSDGVDRSSWLRDEDVVRAARRADVMAYAVTVGEAPSPVLKDLTRATGGAVFEAGNDRDLRALFLRVLAEVRSRYLLGYSPKGGGEPGWHAITVRVKGKTYRVQARPGYARGAREKR
jgi:VWFA-related protein